MTSTNGQGHTSGPWHYESGVFNQEVSQTAASGSIMDADGWYIATIERVGGQEDANARLIAAAPDLLEALQRAEIAVAELCQDQNPANECWNILREVRTALSRVSGGER